MADLRQCLKQRCCCNMDSPSPPGFPGHPPAPALDSAHAIPLHAIPLHAHAIPLHAQAAHLQCPRCSQAPALDLAQAEDGPKAMLPRGHMSWQPATHLAGGAAHVQIPAGSAPPDEQQLCRRSVGAAGVSAFAFQGTNAHAALVCVEGTVAAPPGGGGVGLRGAPSQGTARGPNPLPLRCAML